MYGMNMSVSHNGLTVKLRPFCREDVPVLVTYFSSMTTHMNTMGIFGQTLENELKWYEKNMEDPDNCIWAIQPEGSDVPIGVTDLHHITGRDNACTSGIIIWRQDWWHKGVASATHLARTLFATDYLHRFIIRSTVRTKNLGSLQALLRVGYTVWGTEPRSTWRAGKWLDTYHLAWLHPERIGILYPDGLPEMYAEGVKRAGVALEIARREVTFP